MARPDRSFRTALLLGTALVAGPALALPGAPGTVATNTGGGAPVLTNPVAGTLNVKLNAPRTVLQYSNFGIAAGETVNFRFDQRSDLAVVHATQGAITVDGTLNSFVGAAYGGNVWLLSAAGVFFGAGAHVDVGGLLASTSIPSNLLDQNGPVLTPTALSFDFGNGNGAVTIAGGPNGSLGAQITGHGGTLAFIAPSVTTGRGALISGGGDTSVLYGAAQRYTVRFVQEAGNDLDLLDFEVPGLTAGTAAAMPLALAGTTAAGNVYVAAVNRADAVRAVLDAQGDIGATSAGTEGGSIVLTSGGGIANRAAAPLLTGGAFLQDIQTGGTITASRGVTATATGDVKLDGPISAGGAILASGATVTAADLTSTGDSIMVTATTGDAVVGSGASRLDLSIIALNGLAQVGDAHVGQDFVLRGAQVALGSLGPYSETTGGYGYGGYGYGGGTTTLYPTRDVTIVATAGDLDVQDLGTLAAGRDLTIDISGEFDANNLTAGRNLSATGGIVQILGTATAGEDGRIQTRLGDMFVQTLTAGDDATLIGSATGLLDVNSVNATGTGNDAEGDGANVTVSGYSVSIAEVNAANTLRIDANDTADFGFGPAGAVAGDDIIVRAAAIDFGNIMAGRDLSLTAFAGGVAPGSLGTTAASASAGRDVTIVASDMLGGVDLVAVRDLTLTGASVDVRTATAGRDLTVAATAGDLRLDTAMAGDDIRLSAATFVASGGAAAGGNIDVGFARTTGAVPGGFGDSEGDGFNIVAGGHDIALARAIAPTDIRLTGTGQVTLGIARPDSEDVADAEAGNDIIVIGSSVLTGPLDAGRDLTLTGTGGGIEARSVITAGRNVTGSAPGAISFADDIVADGFVLLAGDSVVATSLEGGSFVNATGRFVTIDQVASRGNSNIIATAGDARVGSASVKNDLTVIADAGLAHLGDARVGHDLLLRGQSVFLGSLDGYTETNGYGGYGGYGYGGYGSTFTRTHDATLIALGGDVAGGATLIVTNDILATATGNVTLGDLDAGNDVRVTAGLALIAGEVTAGRDAILQGGTLATGGITAGRDVSLTATASGITAGDIGAVRDLTLNAAQTLAFDTATAGRDLRLTGTIVDGGTATAGRDLFATATTTLGLGSATAGDDVRLIGATIDVDGAHATGAGEDTEADGSNVVATGGTITLEQVTAAQDILVTGTGPVTVGSAATGAQTGTVGAYYADAGNDIILTGASLLTGPLDAGRDVRLTATAGNIDALDTILAGRDIAGSATGLARFAASLRAGNDIIVQAAGVDASDVDAGNDVTLIAATGDATLGSANVKRDLTVLALLGLAEVDEARVGRDLLMRGGRVVLGSLDGYTETTGYGGYGYGGGGYGYGGGGYGYGGGQTSTFTLTRDVTLDAVITDVVAGSTDLTVSRDIRVTAVRDATLADLDAGNDVLASAGRTLTLGDAVAGRDIVLSGGTLTSGGLNAGRDLSLTATAGSLVSAAGYTAVRDLTVDGVGVTLGSATAGRDLTLNSRTGTLTLTTGTAGDDARLNGATQSLGTVSATGLGMDSEGDGSNIVIGGGAITVSKLTAPTDISVIGTGPVSIGQAAAGRDVTVSGATVGGALQLSGRDVSVTSGGAFSATGGLMASRDLRLTAGTTLSFTQLMAARDLFLTAATVAGGSAIATRDLTVNATVAITGTLYQAGRDLVLDPNEAINVTTASAGGNATLVGASIVVGTLTVGGNTSAIATAGGLRIDTFTGHAATLIATGKVDLGAATGDAIRIVGGDLDVRNSLVASSLQVETPGQMILGGTAAPGETGFRLAGADIARLKVTGIASFYAGTTTGNGNGDGGLPSGNFIVQDFAFDPANLPRIALFADRSHIVDVQGVVAPSDVGGSFQIGDSDPDGRFRPASIYVSGSLGTAELVANCFGKVVPANSLSLYTVGDVIFGDAGFRSAVQSTPAGSIDIFAAVPSTPPRTDSHLFAVTTRLVVQAGGKVVSQNTASGPGDFAGILVIGTGATTPIVDIGAAAAADLSGSIIDRTGVLRSGPLVARASELGPGGLNGAIFRFNGCIVGGGICTAGGSDIDTPSTALRVEDYQPPRPVDLTDSPLSTVLIADNVVGKTGQLTVINESNGIVIRSVTVLDALPAPDVTPQVGTRPDATSPTGSCNVVPGTNGSNPDCPVKGGPR